MLFSVNKIQTEAEIFNLGHRNKSNGTKQISYNTIIECHKQAKRFMGLRIDSDLNTGGYTKESQGENDQFTMIIKERLAVK